MRLKLDPQYSLQEMEGMLGSFFDPQGDDSWVVLEGNENVECVREDGSLIASIKRQVIGRDLTELAEKCYMRVGKTVSSNRGHAAGLGVRGKSHRSYEKGVNANSGIMGFMDNTNLRRPCRLTQFSNKHFDLYKEGLPFIKCIADNFCSTVPDAYERQRDQATKTSFHIEGTPFSTVTVNYNFRTALHKDSGDYRQGFGNLVVCQKGISGGNVLFPRYKLAIAINTGDFLAMDVHEYHCNSPINVVEPQGYRLSFVCYLRDRMVECTQVNEKIERMGGGKKNATDWIHDIFSFYGEDVPEKQTIGEGSFGHTWWEMKGDHATVRYHHKRYTLIDHCTQQVIRELAPAWEYAFNNRRLSQEDDG